MSAIYENFSSLPVGSRLTPPGWTDPFGYTLILYGIIPENPNSHICQVTVGNLTQFNTFPPLFPSATLLWFAGLSRNSVNDVNFGTILGADPFNNQPVPLISAEMEADSSVSIFVNGQRPINGNTGLNNFYIQQDGMYFFQLNYSATQNPITTELEYGLIQLAINGTRYIDTTFQHTGIFGNSGTVWGAEFGPPVQGALNLAEISLGSLVSIPTYPNPGVYPYPHGLVSQGVLELGLQPGSSNARVSQGVIELMQLPNRSNARISQGVIEVATQNNTPIAGNGWKVVEV